MDDLLGPFSTMLIAITCVSVLALSFAFARRSAHYRRLSRLLAEHHKRLADIGSVIWQSIPDFGQRLAVIPKFLPAQAFEDIRAEATRLATVERSHIPTHKKGGTVAYERVIEHAPVLAELYHSPEMARLVSRIVGLDVKPTPLHDQSSLSVLFYDRPGDHIGWHYDHNFYRGRHFTVLIPLVNDGHAEGGLSHATLIAKLDGVDRQIATPPNTLIIFEGARVLHRVTPIRDGERRLVLSMTYCADPRAGFFRETARRIKDTAFFGVRALWT